MGGFFLAKREKDVALETTERQYSRSVDVFRKKGLPLNKKLVTQDYIIYVFHKYRHDRDNTLLHENGDFIISTGTMLYNGRMGEAALQELYEDFSMDNQDFFSRLLGNYCVIISKGDNLFLCNNSSGVYRVYCDQTKKVISSSFLAVYKSLDEHRLEKQEFYEYMFDGALYGDKTLIGGIELVDSKKIVQLTPVLTDTPKNLDFSTPAPDATFDEMVNEGVRQTTDYYHTIQAYYGDSVCAGITAGMDSRLMLAGMRAAGITPYLYIYGKEDSSEVKTVEMIATGEGLQLDIEEKFSFPRVGRDDYPGFLEKQYYMLDGLGNFGIFDNGSDMATRYKRVEKSRLQLNGGGYQMRLFYSLPNKPTPINTFLRAKHDGGDFSMCRRFDKKAYYSILEQKIKETLDVERDIISRKQVEQLFFDWRIKYWTAFNHMINEQLSDSLLPGVDPQLTALILNIPYKYLYLGSFQAAIIKKIHPDIARYPSQYGFNFYDYDKVPLRTKIDRFVQFHTPVALRPFFRKNILTRNIRRITPYYLTKEYLDTILPSSNLIVSEYVDISKITDFLMLSRVLSVELLLKDLF
jgi:hypothetical protein